MPGFKALSTMLLASRSEISAQAAFAEGPNLDMIGIIVVGSSTILHMLSTIKQQVRVTTSTLSLRPRESIGSIATKASDSTHYLEYCPWAFGLTRSVTGDNADILAWTIGVLREISAEWRCSGN